MTHVGWWQILKAGGPTLVLLAILSIYSVAVMWEKWVTFKRFSRLLKESSHWLNQLLNSGDIKKAVELCKKQKTTLHWIFHKLLTARGSRDERRDISQRAIERQVAQLQSGLTTLGTIGSVAPFIGLFGTVLGVMRAFRDLAAFEGAGPGVVAVGIAEALVATAAGLFVAVPAIVAYNFFNRRLQRLSEELSWTAEEILDRNPSS